MHLPFKAFIIIIVFNNWCDDCNTTFVEFDSLTVISMQNFEKYSTEACLVLKYCFTIMNQMHFFPGSS